jgi:hypothetical protein
LAENDSSELTIEDAVQEFKNRGQHWQSLVGGKIDFGHLVYRGTDIRFAHSFFIQAPRRNRLPLNTPVRIHKIADEYFEKKFGIKFRSESLFVSQRPSLAKYYGKCYVIFPLDDVKILWSPKSEDFFMSLEKLNLPKTDEKDAIDDERIKVMNMLQSLDYTDDPKSLKAFFNERQFFNNELMIYCDEYLGVEEEEISKFLRLLNQ